MHHDLNSGPCFVLFGHTQLFEGIGGCETCSCVREASNRSIVAVRTTDCDVVAAQLTHGLGGRGIIECTVATANTAHYLLLGQGAHLTMIEKLTDSRDSALPRLVNPDRGQLDPVPPSWIDRARLLGIRGRRQIPPPTPAACQVCGCAVISGLLWLTTGGYWLGTARRGGWREGVCWKDL